MIHNIFYNYSGEMYVEKKYENYKRLFFFGKI